MTTCRVLCLSDSPGRTEIRPLAEFPLRLVYIFPSGPKNPSVLYSKTKTFLGTCLHSFNSVRYGSQQQEFDAVQWGK